MGVPRYVTEAIRALVPGHDVAIRSRHSKSFPAHYRYVAALTPATPIFCAGFGATEARARTELLLDVLNHLGDHSPTAKATYEAIVTSPRSLPPIKRKLMPLVAQIQAELAASAIGASC